MRLIGNAIISILTITLYADYPMSNCITDNVIPTKSVKSENFDSQGRSQSTTEMQLVRFNNKMRHHLSNFRRMADPLKISGKLSGIAGQPVMLSDFKDLSVSQNQQ